jgi:hypothetical protein
MANSFDASLVNTVLAQKAVSKLQTALGWLPAFTTDFTDEVRDQRSRTLNIAYSISGSAIQTNPTNFETGDNKLMLRAVTLNHLSKSFYITSADYGKGTRLETLADTNLNTLAYAIEAAVFTLITSTNYTTSIPATLSAVATNGTTAALLKTLWGTLPGTVKNCILKDAYFAPVLPSDMYGFDITKTRTGYGFDYLGHTGSGFASAGSKIVGFAANPSAIVIGAAIPEYSGAVANLLDSQVVDIPGLGLSIQSNVWGSAASRNTWGSYDVLFGAAVGDDSSLTLMVEA